MMRSWCIFYLALLTCHFRCVLGFVPVGRPYVQSRQPQHQQTQFHSNKRGDDDDRDDGSDSLQKRIQDIETKRAEKQEASYAALSRRLQELRSSEQLEEQMLSSQLSAEEDEGSSSLGTNPTLDLPVICFDAILPGQLLEGRTEDPTFMQFLGRLGLGGWFVMVSLDHKTRRIRRHGTVCKIELVDSMLTDQGNANEVGKNSLGRTPTAVDFSIKGMYRARLVGPSQRCKLRIGRWRRGYDPNGEEIVLGWGEESLLDLHESVVNEHENKIGDAEDKKTSTHHSEWNTNVVECLLQHGDGTVDPTLAEKAASLQILVRQWYELASDSNTYVNPNVTATAVRIFADNSSNGNNNKSPTQNSDDVTPLFLCEPSKRLERVMEALSGEIRLESAAESSASSSLTLGPSPLERPTDYCFWAAAVMNPLPPLGVSMEIRGRLLEAPRLEYRINILKHGLMRSIENLQGIRPL